MTFPVRKISVPLLFKAVLLSMMVGCSSDEIPGDSRKPRCEVRGNTEPARLNIDTWAKDYGITKPCQASLKFYIAKNTSLDSIEGRLILTRNAGDIIREDVVYADLEKTNSGMLQKRSSDRSYSRGKSGGVRVIYYWVADAYQVRMLYAYPKGQQENLSKEQLKALRQIVGRWSDE